MSTDKEPYDVPPPEEVTVTEPSQAPPPSYDSIFGKVKAAKEESDSNTDFLKAALGIILGSIGCTICLAIVLAIPMSMIVMGSVFLKECPVEPYIPIYLIVCGAFTILQFLLNMLFGCLRKKGDDGDQGDRKGSVNPCDGIIGCFLLAWFIAGNVWIYRTYNEFSEVPGSDNYCHPKLYYFAFWVTTVGYIGLALGCCCACCGALVGVAMGGKK